MEFKQVYNKHIFNTLCKDIWKEYKHDQYIKYNKEKIKNEKQKLLNREWLLFCAFKQNKVFGYICLQQEDKINATIKQILIKPKYRKQGCGKFLINNIETWAKENGIKKLSLAARRGRENFYIACGYNGIGVLQKNINEETKENIENFLNKQNIKILNYKIWNNEVHQFYFVAKEILKNSKFLNTVDENNYNVQIVFSKNI